MLPKNACIQPMFAFKASTPPVAACDNAVAPVRKQATVTTGYDWAELYPDAEEDIPEDAPPPQGNLATLTCYVDADHARDKVTRKSVTGIVLMLNNTPVVAISKRQKTVETSTFGSELIAARIAVELLIEWRYKMRMLGLVVEDRSWLVGDNMSVVVNTTLPSSSLKKKHLACNYHKVREAVACFLIFGHIDFFLVRLGKISLSLRLFFGAAQFTTESFHLLLQ